MVKSSASRKHQIIEKHIENIIENLTLPPGWVLQRCKPEETDLETNNRPDVMVVWSKHGGKKRGKYILFIEIQKDMSNKTFKEKLKHYSLMVHNRSLYSFLVINEEEAPNDIFELDDYLTDRITYNLPW